MNLTYLLLKTAQGLYGKAPAALDPNELRRAERAAMRQLDLEARVLARPEAQGVMVPEATLDATLEEVISRYPDRNEFEADLAGNGLTLGDYRQALARELRVEAVLERVASRIEPVTDEDITFYCRSHPEQFQRPERRRARHILVTINETLAENHSEAARARIMAIAQRLAQDPGRFEEQAMQHSECPTALQGGLLGDVKPGQLYPELDRALFTLEPMALSPVLESSLGLHLLRCDQVLPADSLPLETVKEQLREALTQQRKNACQKAWLKGLDKPRPLEY